MTTVNGMEAADGTPIDIVQEHRDRALMLLGLALAPFLIPFSVNSFVQQRYLMGVLTALVVSVAAVNSIGLLRWNVRPIPLPFVMFTVMVGLLSGFSSLGQNGTFWCYPVPLVYHFVATRKEAERLDLAFFLCIVPAAFYFFPFPTASRFVITLGMVSYFASLLVRVIVDLQSQLTQITITDPLTGAYNRRHMEVCLHDAVELTQRGSSAASILALDIDHFKHINDTYGHDVGDQVLRKLAHTVHGRLRTVDRLFRMGGEEFAVLVPGTPLEGGVHLAEDLRRLIGATSLIEERTITVSIGVAEYEPGEDATRWCKRADTLLYEAKRDGRNRVAPALEHSNSDGNSDDQPNIAVHS